MFNIPINYTINGGTPVTEMIADTLEPDDTLQYTFMTTTNLSALGTYDVDVYTAYRNDPNQLNDTARGNYTQVTAVSSFPYVEGFENGANGWVSGGVNNSWAIGTPSGSIINSAATGLNAFATNPTGPYNDKEKSYVKSPCFDFSTLNFPQLKMNVWWSSELPDGAVLQMSFDNGLTWDKVGDFLDFNWYNNNNVTGLGNLEPSSEGWAGTFNDGSGAWIAVEHDLIGAANQPAVQLRIAFGSDDYFTADGFAFDDVIIQDAAPIDGSVVEIVRPFTECDLGTNDSVEVRIRNSGSIALSNIPLEYILNSNPAVADTFPGTLNPGDTANFVFSTSVNLSTVGSYSIRAYTLVPGDTVPTNNEATLDFSNVPLVTALPYNEDFEMGNGGWIPSGVNSSWAQGPPTASVINSAGSGLASYVTNLSGHYNLSELSYLTSPCFDLTAYTADPILKFKNTFGFDYEGEAWLEQSIDGGATWTKVLDNGGASEWYNNTNNQYWDNTSSQGLGVWVDVENILIGLAGEASVRLRFVFDGSEYNNFAEGFGIDQISLEDPPMFDAGVIAITTPVHSCNLGMFDTVRVQVKNFGINTLTSIPISYELNSGTPITETITTSLAAGDTLDYTFTSASVNLASNGLYNFRVYTALTADGNATNDSATTSIENTLKSVPYFENFDSFTPGTNFDNSGSVLLSGWAAFPSGPPNYSWGARSIAPFSQSTGPSADHTGNGGNYIYVEGNNGFSGAVAELVSPCIDISSITNARLEFWYHKFGNTMDDLFIDIFDGATWTSNVDSIIGETQLSQTAPYLLKSIDISAFTGNTIQVRFRTAPRAGSEVSMAIDDFVIFEPSDDDANIIAITGPNSSCGLVSDTIRVTFSNNGINVLDTVPLSYVVNGAAPVSDTSFATLNPGDTSSFAFNVPVNLTAVGDYSIQVYSDVTNDMYALNDTTSTQISNDTVVGFPYSEDFETSDGGWISYGSNSSWEWGAPSGVDISTAGSGMNAWVTNLSGSHNDDELSYLESPCIDLSMQTNDPVIRFLHTFETDSLVDEGWLEISTNGGATWTKSVDNGSAQNWYNNLSFQRWTGKNSSGAGIYDTTMNVLSGTAGFSAVRVRFVFSSNSFIAFEGFAVDRVEIDVLTSVNEINDNSTFELSIFPNPTAGVFTLVAPESSDAINIQILDTKGQLVHNQVLTTNSARRSSIDMSANAKGIYFVRMSDSKTSTVKKLIVR